SGRYSDRSAPQQSSCSAPRDDVHMAVRLRTDDPSYTSPLTARSAGFRRDPACHFRRKMMRTLFLNPPSYDDFDGGAGARYQAKREVWSFWYPTWLSYPAGMLPGARLLDAPPENMSVEEVVSIAKDYDHVVLHTSTPSFRADVRTAQALKSAKPDTVI